MNSAKPLIILTAVIAGLMTIQTVWLMKYSDKKLKTGYILTQQVFEGFDGTKQIKFKLKNQETRQKRIIDSIAVEYKMTATRTDKAGKEKTQQLKELYNSLYNKFSEESAQDVEKYNSEVWKQINQYITEYGKENSYSVLYGADGTGNLMYADTTLNISNDVIAYINKRYADQ